MKYAFLLVEQAVNRSTRLQRVRASGFTGERGGSPIKARATSRQLCLKLNHRS